jgi:release factor glutamine methyltransferase
MSEWTIQKLLAWITQYFTEKGVDSPRLSAELLLSHVLGLPRIELYTKFDSAVEKAQLAHLHELVKRCGEHEPPAYVIGQTEFYSLRLKVSRDCMIPRPETELLVERAVESLRRRTGPQLVCDLCTGCGCIAIAIAKNFAAAKLYATDISDAALSMAAENTKMHGLDDRIELLCGDLFEPILPSLNAGRFDLIVCNPPYVSAAEYETLDKNVRNYEPRRALYAGADGLDIYRGITQKSSDFLKPDGALMLEIGYARGPAVKQLLQQSGAFAEIKIEKDFHNIERIVIALKRPS